MRTPTLQGEGPNTTSLGNHIMHIRAMMETYMYIIVMVNWGGRRDTRE